MAATLGYRPRNSVHPIRVRTPAELLFNLLSARRFFPDARSGRLPFFETHTENVVNLYRVQHGDRPLFVMAKDFNAAFERWRLVLAVENPEDDCSEEIPQGVEHVATANEIALPVEWSQIDMTVEEYCQDYLVSHGMFPNQAEGVIAIVKSKGESEDPKVNNGLAALHWSSPTEGYPPQLLVVLKMVLASNAIEWIDANLPKAWYRPMFAMNAPTSAHKPIGDQPMQSHDD